MGKRILNIIDIERGAHPVKSALSLAEEWLNHNPEAPNETGGMLLQNDDCDAFKAALQTAVDSLVKYHDFDQYTHFDIQETSDSDTTTAPAISDNTEEEKFPF